MRLTLTILATDAPELDEHALTLLIARVATSLDYIVDVVRDVAGSPVAYNLIDAGGTLAARIGVEL